MEYRPIRGVNQTAGHRLVPTLDSRRPNRYRRSAWEYLFAAVLAIGLLLVVYFINSYIALREDNASLNRTVTYLQRVGNECRSR